MDYFSKEEADDYNIKYDEDEDVICNECLEEMYESRINDMSAFTHMIPKKVKE